MSAWTGTLDARDTKRFLSKVALDDGIRCWGWTGTKLSKGYGHFYAKGKMRMAHRVSYEHFSAPIPDGLQLDHLCRNRACVNPLHLEPVTGVENVRRGASFAAVNARKTHCPQGHPYEGDNLVVIKNGRDCRACRRERNRRYDHRRRHPEAGL